MRKKTLLSGEIGKGRAYYCATENPLPIPQTIEESEF